MGSLAGFFSAFSLHSTVSSLFLFFVVLVSWAYWSCLLSFSHSRTLISGCVSGSFSLVEQLTIIWLSCTCTSKPLLLSLYAKYSSIACSSSCSRGFARYDSEAVLSRKPCLTSLFTSFAAIRLLPRSGARMSTASPRLNTLSLNTLYKA